MQIPESSYSEIFTKRIPNASVEMQEQICEVFSSDQTQAENERLRSQHQRRIEAASQKVRKQELERNQIILQLNQLGSEI